MKTGSIAGLSLTISLLTIAAEAVKTNDWWADQQQDADLPTAVAAPAEINNEDWWTAPASNEIEPETGSVEDDINASLNKDN